MCVLQVIITALDVLQVNSSGSVIIFVFQMHKVLGYVFSSTCNCIVRLQVSLKVWWLNLLRIVTVSVTCGSDLFLMFNLALLVILNNIFLLLFLFKFFLLLLHKFWVLKMSEVNIHYFLNQSVHFTFIFFYLVYVYYLFLF
jgi:hypothetical protein